MNIAQLKTIKHNFVKELQDADAGKKTSLPFIVHKLSSVPIVKDEEVFEVLIVGGTILKKVLCKKIKGQISIIKKETERPIGFSTESEFLRFIDRELAKDVNVLALNFAYPLKPVFRHGRLDGILMSATKEGGFHGLVGKKIGKEIENYITGQRKRSNGQNFPRGKFCLCQTFETFKTSVANDTICLLLSGLMKYRWNELAAGIVGTGFNIAFFLDKEKLVNLESANFDKFPISWEAKKIDKESSQPGRALFEKEISGAYLYRHFNLKIKERKINFALISSTEELNTISKHPYSSSDLPTATQLLAGGREVNNGTIESGSGLSNALLGIARTITSPQASKIARDLLKRSAQLVACQIAGITEFKKKDPTSPRLRGASMVFNMEGSLFWKGNNYKEIVEETVRQLVPKYNVKFAKIKDSAILGAAKLVA